MLPGRTEDAVKIRWKSHCRVWRARKYLRKTSSDQPGGVRRSGESSETESLSGMETPLAMTPMTPGYGHAFAWPSGGGNSAIGGASSGTTPRSRSSSSSNSSSGSATSAPEHAAATETSSSDAAVRVQ